jgi:hypothetical protein
LCSVEERARDLDGVALAEVAQRRRDAGSTEPTGLLDEFESWPDAATP